MRGTPEIPDSPWSARHRTRSSAAAMLLTELAAAFFCLPPGRRPERVKIILCLFIVFSVCLMYNESGAGESAKKKLAGGPASSW